MTNSYIFSGKSPNLLELSFSLSELWEENLKGGAEHPLGRIELNLSPCSGVGKPKKDTLLWSVTTPSLYWSGKTQKGYPALECYHSFIVLEWENPKRIPCSGVLPLLHCTGVGKTQKGYPALDCYCSFIVLEWENPKKDILLYSVTTPSLYWSGKNPKRIPCSGVLPLLHCTGVEKTQKGYPALECYRSFIVLEWKKPKRDTLLWSVTAPSLYWSGKNPKRIPCSGVLPLLHCIVLYCIVLYCIVLYCILLYCIVLCCIVLYCVVLYCSVLYCVVLYCSVLYCIVLYCTILYCIVVYCIVLYCIVLHCTVLYCIVLYCTILYCTVLYCTVLYCTVLYCTVLYCTVLYCTVLYCTVLYCTVLYCTVLYCTVLYCTVLYCTVLYCTVLYCTVLYCTVLYCTVLYCTVLYCTVLYCTVPYRTVLYCIRNTSFLSLIVQSRCNPSI